MTGSVATKMAGVMGWPIAHSLSPRLHRHWLEEMGIDGVYLPLPVQRHEFASAIAALRKLGFAGVNVTVPHKQAAFSLAHENDPAAVAAGAANLLIFREDGRIEGRNTDAIGLAESLMQALGSDALRGKAAVLLGSGGAARAAILSLALLGVAEIRIVARHHHSGTVMAQDLRQHVAARLSVFAWNDIAQAASNTEILINATDAGMTGKAPLDVALDAVPHETAVCDLIYNPLRTDLLKRAQARGHRTVDGLCMLMHQAVPSFEAFYGVRPKVTDDLRAVLLKALGHG